MLCALQWQAGMALSREEGRAGGAEMSLSRRHMLGAAAALPFVPKPACAAESVTVTIDPRVRLRTLAADSVGLGYEISSVSV